MVKPFLNKQSTFAMPPSAHEEVGNFGMPHDMIHKWISGLFYCNRLLIINVHSERAASIIEDPIDLIIALWRLATIPVFALYIPAKVVITLSPIPQMFQNLFHSWTLGTPIPPKDNSMYLPYRLLSVSSSLRYKRPSFMIIKTYSITYKFLIL